MLGTDFAYSVHTLPALNLATCVQWESWTLRMRIDGHTTQEEGQRRAHQRDTRRACIARSEKGPRAGAAADL